LTEGPYEYVPPVYWYTDTLHGGAYGFNTETGPGAQVPPVESVREMILDAETGHFIAPVYLDDNYFSLLPGEKRTIKGYCYNSDLKGKSLKLKISGLNVR